MDKYGVIDIGSNTMRLVVYKWDNNKLNPILNKKEAAGLAGYVDEGQCMTRAGIEKAVLVLLEFKEIVQSIDIKEVFVLATASLRNIENTEEVRAELQERTGMQIRVLSGTEEAMYDYMGAIRAVNVNDGLIVDIGGGSTEFVLFNNKKLLSAHSIKMGSLTLFTRYVSEIVPRKKEMEIIQERVEEELRKAVQMERRAHPETICAVGGTARAVNEIISAQFPDDTERNGSYPVKSLKKILDIYMQEKKYFVQLVLKNAPDRIHTIIPGLIILTRVAEYCESKQIVTSPYGVREGCLYSKLLKDGE